MSTNTDVSIDNLIPVAIDLRALAHIIAGGELLLPDLGIKLVPASDVYRIALRVKVRENGGRLTVRGHKGG